MFIRGENDLKKNNYLNYYVFIAFPVEFLLGSYINVMFLKTPVGREKKREKILKGKSKFKENNGKAYFITCKRMCWFHGVLRSFFMDEKTTGVQRCLRK